MNGLLDCFFTLWGVSNYIWFMACNLAKVVYSQCQLILSLCIECQASEQCLFDCTSLHQCISKQIEMKERNIRSDSVYCSVCLFPLIDPLSAVFWIYLLTHSNWINIMTHECWRIGTIFFLFEGKKGCLNWKIQCNDKYQKCWEDPIYIFNTKLDQCVIWNLVLSSGVMYDNAIARVLLGNQ